MRSRTALEALQLKRSADHAFFRDMVKRQRRALEQVPEPPAAPAAAAARAAES